MKGTETFIGGKPKGVGLMFLGNCPSTKYEKWLAREENLVVSDYQAGILSNPKF